MIRVRDLAYAKFAVTDLDLARQFLTDFGLSVSHEAPGEIAFSTADGNPYAYVAYQLDRNEFLGFALEAASEKDLVVLTDSGIGRYVAPVIKGFGGQCVATRHPDGFVIEVVHGRNRMPQQSVRDPLAHNFGTAKQRINKSQRPPKGATPALRLGHIALNVSSAEDSAEWFKNTFGLKEADFLVTPDETQALVGVFMSFDPLEEVIDHHSVFVSQSDTIKLHHIAFEVQDIDAVMSAHDFLINQGYAVDVGVGRHMAGSQVFDYWTDPFGSRIEHYSDGDVIDSTHNPGTLSGTPVELTQWGPIPPETFFQ